MIILLVLNHNFMLSAPDMLPAAAYELRNRAPSSTGPLFNRPFPRWARRNIDQTIKSRILKIDDDEAENMSQIQTRHLFLNLLPSGTLGGLGERILILTPIDKGATMYCTLLDVFYTLLDSIPSGNEATSHTRNKFAVHRSSLTSDEPVS